MLVGDGERGVAGERRMPGNQFVEHAAGGVDVAAPVGHLAARLLGGEVLGGADDGGGLRHGGGRVRRGVGDAKVHDLHVAGVGDHDVRRFDVPVHDARRMRGGERLRHGYHDLGCLAYGQWAHFAQGFAVHELHDDVRHLHAVALDGARVKHTDDGRVVELGAVLRLFFEPVAKALVAGEIVAQDLNGYVAAEDGVGRLVDVAHATGADGVA